VADAATVGIELLEDVAGTQMSTGAPENFEHKTPLAAETQTP
jgi:hypothetical protein